MITDAPVNGLAEQPVQDDRSNMFRFARRRAIGNKMKTVVPAQKKRMSLTKREGTRHFNGIVIQLIIVAKHAWMTRAGYGYLKVPTIFNPHNKVMD